MRSGEFFSRERFAAYLKKQFVESWRTNLVRSLLLFAGLFVCCLWVSLTVYPWHYDDQGVLLPEYDLKNDPVHELEMVFFSVLLLIVGCFTASRFLHDARRKGERIAMLTTPVSTFENWLTRWLLCVPSVLLVFFACLYAADALRVAIFTPIYPEIPVRLLNPFVTVGGGMPLWDMFLCYFLLTGFYLLGSVFFPRRAMLTTTVILFFVGWFYLAVLTGGSSLYDQQSRYDYTLGHLLTRVFLWGVVLCLWWLSYLRLKELEVIDRL